MPGWIDKPSMVDVGSEIPWKYESFERTDNEKVRLKLEYLRELIRLKDIGTTNNERITKVCESIEKDLL